MSFIHKKSLLGRSMIEMLGVLAVIGVLSAGGIWGYNIAMGNYRINKLVQDITTSMTQAQYFFQGKTSASIGSPEVLKRFNLIPKDYKTVPCALEASDI